MEHSDVLKSTKAKLRPTVMRALGIYSEHKGDKMTYEQFLNMCSLLRYKRQTKEDMINFTARLFDPTMSGFVPNAKFEEVLDLMFEVEEPAKKEVVKKKVEIKIPEEEASESRSSKPSSKASEKDDDEKDSDDSEEEKEKPKPKEQLMKKSDSEIMRAI